ncbi:DUF4115 domain-containing protein [Salinimonas marina]|uniref:DUF4115 domain-containing protein n=1 Tax=Salinimonas marina TaxID=2785918 RepID=A0A7S9HDS6_9ALTE|nr:RodZ domain-containing protein [Salinimonas marina]QPG06469.1 DUF4115 domain-containing protein [Salinimonas marina]
MNPEETTEENVGQAPTQNQQTPGKMLREARLQQGLSQQDVAAKLFLKAHTIEHIESDKIDESMSVTFTKGYVRNYAKFLGIDHEKVIEEFNRLHTATKPPAALQSFSQRVAKQAHDDRWMMVTWVILLLLIAAVVVWWYQQDDNTTQQNASVSAPATSVTARERESKGVSERHRQPATDTRPTAEKKTLAESAETSSLMSAPTNDEAQKPVETSAPAEQADTDASLAAAREPASEASSPGAPESMQFTFDDECWVNIVDASGEVLATGIKRAGRVMEITGQPPISVTLGAPDDVAIVYAGEKVDISGFQNGRTARFSLPLQD